MHIIYKSNFEELTLMTGFVLQGHIYVCVYYIIE